MGNKPIEIFEVKEFSSSYVAAIQQLLNQLISTPLVFTENDLKEIISSNSAHLFFLQKEGQIIGMFTVGIYKTPTGLKGWLEDVVVDNAFRGKGFGRLLVEHSITFTKVKGADTFMLTSNPTRVAANNLYRSLGFEHRETNVYKISFK